MTTSFDFDSNARLNTRVEALETRIVAVEEKLSSDRLQILLEIEKLARSIDNLKTSAKFAAVKEELGRDVTIFETSMPSLAPPKESSDDKFLKTRKIREAQKAARRSRITKSTIRVRFPDNITLETTFNPSGTCQSLMDLLSKAITLTRSCHFTYVSNIPEGAASSPYLKEDIMSLKDLEPILEEPAKPDIKIGENGEKLGKKIEEVSGRISEASSSSKVGIPCMDRLREELSCAICLEICYEPSTTSCGHSFCRRCLRSAADKCGKKCPKCRQLIGNGSYCTVNTVLWNTVN